MLILSDPGTGAEHVQATRDSAGSYALIYLPTGKAVELDLSRLAGEQLIGYWYNPRNGTSRRIGTIQNERRMRFTPPPGGPDWVLVLDDANAGYPFPGSR